MSGWIAHALVVLGLLVVTAGVYGVVRLEDVFNQLHASSKVSFIGVVALLGAASMTGEWPIIGRAVIIAVLLTITTPVAAHVIAQAAWRRGERPGDPARGGPDGHHR